MISNMWWSVLTLSFIAGQVFVADGISLPVSVNFGDNLINFSETSDGIYYKIDYQDGSSNKNEFVIYGFNLTRNNRQYSVIDCSTDEEICLQFNTDDCNLELRRNISSRLFIDKHILTSNSDDLWIGICLVLNDGVQWFGGPETKYQLWPVQDAQWDYASYYPKEDDALAITEPYWVSSTGSFIYANPENSLFLDQNSKYADRLCLYAQNTGPYRKRNGTTLEYWIGNLGDPKTVHQTVVETFFGKPTGIPDQRMITHPIWSSWARYKIYVNESIVREYADEILKNGFNHSQIEIDDFWETCYGSLNFSTNADKFPDIKNLTDDLHDLGFRVTLWIHPFINVECEEYYEIARINGYFAKNENGSILTTWWQGENASVIDFTNEDAVAWFSERLKALQESAGIDSFKFDAGEASWMPEPAVLTASIDESPGIYTNKFARALAEFGNGIEVRTGRKTQDLPIFVRMLDKDTSWTMNNGLPTLITTLLVMNLAGYGFVLPDMVGGNGYIDGVLVSTEYPSKELFIRWLQANTFMPTIQYSFVPWDYDNETIEICRTYTKLHEEYAPTIIEAMNAAVIDGTPVNPPVWWLDPTNSDAFNISDEYLLGEYILVAPVIVEGAVTRNIFLPSAIWRDANTDNIYEGPTWIYDYPAPLNILPYFIKVGEVTSTSTPVTESSNDSASSSVSRQINITHLIILFIVQLFFCDFSQVLNFNFNI